MPFRILPAAFLILILFAAPVMADVSASPGPEDRCAVCGMFVAPYPHWISVIRFEDGASAWFDGPKDMFVFFMDMGKYRPDSATAKISGIFVTEYYTTRLIKAEKVYFITGSDVMGPMGKELVPIEGHEKAETFLRDHGGKKILRFDGKDFQAIPKAK